MGKQQVRSGDPRKRVPAPKVAPMAGRRPRIVSFRHALLGAGMAIAVGLVWLAGGAGAVWWLGGSPGAVAAFVILAGGQWAIVVAVGWWAGRRVARRWGDRAVKQTAASTGVVLGAAGWFVTTAATVAGASLEGPASISSSDWVNLPLWIVTAAVGCVLGWSRRRP